MRAEPLPTKLLHYAHPCRAGAPRAAAGTRVPCTRAPCAGTPRPATAPRGRASSRTEAETPGLKIEINSTPTHFLGTRYPIECQKVSYTLYIVSKSVIYALYSVKKCLIHSISCYFQSWCFSLHGPHPTERGARSGWRDACNARHMRLTLGRFGRNCVRAEDCEKTLADGHPMTPEALGWNPKPILHRIIH